MASGNIKGITIQLGADTTKLSSALRSADSAIKNTQSNLKALEKELKLNPGNTNLLVDKQRALSNEILNTKSRLETLNEAQRQMDASGVDKNSDAYRNLQTEIDVTKAKLGDLEKEQNNFGSVGAQKIAAVGTKVKGVGQTMSDVGTKMTVGFTAPVVAGAVSAVSSYGDVEKQFNLVKETMGSTSNTASDFKELWNQIGTSAKNSTFGMQDATDATLNFARQGFNAKEAADMLTPAMSLAAGTGTDLSEVTSGLGNTLKMFGANSNEAAGYADVLATAQASANTTTTDLFDAMSTAGPICKTVGWDVKDLATITELFGEAGTSGSEGANALKIGLARLASPAKAGKEAMDELGLSTGQTYAIFDDNGSLKSMPEVLGNLNSAFSGLSDQERLEAASAIFGKEQMGHWMQLIGTSPEKVSSLRDSLDDCTGSADRMSDAMMNGTGGAIEQLKSTFDVLKVTLGEQLAPAFEPVIKGLTDMMNGFMNLSPQTQQMIMRIVAVVAAIGPLLTVGGKLLIGIGTFMEKAPQIQAAITAIKTALSSTPGVIGIVIAAIAAAVVALVTLYRENETFRNFVNTVWNGIKTVVTTVVNAVKTAVTTAWNAIKTVTTTVWNAIKTVVTTVWNAIKTTATTVFTAISGFFSGIWNTIKSTFETVVNGIATFLQGAWDGISTTVQTVWNGISNIVSTVWETIKSVVQVGIMFIQNLLEAAFDILTLPWQFIWVNFGDEITQAWEAIKSVVSTALDAIKSVIETVWNAIKDVITPILDAIKSAVETAWNAIKNVTSTVFDAVKSVASTVWNAIKTVVTTVTNAIKTAVETAWNAIKSVTSTVWNGVKSVTSSAWNGIKSAVTTAVNAIKSVVSSVFNAVKNVVSNVWNGIKSVTSSIWNAVKSVISSVVDAIKSKVSSVFNSLKSAVSGPFNAIKSTATTVWNAIKKAITKPVEDARNAVKKAIDKMKSYFHFSWSLPKLKLPHVRITGHFSLNPPSAPHFGISWYKKGGIMTAPTIFGAYGNTLMAGGEAGAEAILPLEGFYKELDKMLDKKLDKLGSGTTDVYVYCMMDGETVAEKVYTKVENEFVSRMQRKR